MALEGPLRTVAAGALLLALLTGCGESERDRMRERVNAYISDEQDVMRRAEPEFRRANEMYVAYARGELAHDAAASGAERAVRSIRGARDDLTTLAPPAEARELHDRVVAYLDLNVDVARETERLAEYVPAAETASRRLRGANRALRERLGDAADGDAQAGALRRFGAAVGATLAELRALDPPSVLEPAHEHQTRQLTHTRRLTARLRRALEAQDAEQVARLLRRFRGAAAEQRPPRVAAKQALARYARRLQELASAYAGIRREQVALTRKLS
jgi:hypothetical protein